MTYQDVLSDLTNLLDRHKMIQTWGYGNLSDLVAPFKKEDKAGNATDVYDIDYPYAFLQPLQHSLQKGKVAYNFNLIMMEQCKNEPDAVIQAQSHCQQYIQDVLAEIYYNYDQKYDFALNSSLTPFKEKYDDTVSGMTANISLEIPMILNDCVAPFEPKTELIVSVTNFQSQVIDFEAPEDFSDIFRFDASYINDGGWVGSIRYDIPQDGVYTFVLEYEFEFDTAQPGDVYPNQPVLSYRIELQPLDNMPSTTIKGYPETPASGVKYKVTQTWNNVPLVSNSNQNQVFMQVEDTAGNDIAMLVSPYPTLKIYRQV